MGEEKKYSWVEYIHQRIEKNKNFIGMISGPTGSGKTWAGLSIAELLDKDFNIDRVVFKATELMALVNSGTLKSGSVILWDEAGIDLSSRSWQSAMNKMLNFLLQTFRHKNIILFLTAPYGDFVDSASRKLFHAEFETVSINKELKKCTIKPKLLQYNSSNKKWYRKYLRVIKEEMLVKIKRWAIPKPSKEIINVYEEKKEKFTDSLNREIERTLLSIDKVEEDVLTDRQRDIVGFWKKGIYNRKYLSEQIGIQYSQLNQNVRWMRKKGFDEKKFQEEFPKREIRDILKTGEPTT